MQHRFPPTFLAILCILSLKPIAHAAGPAAPKQDLFSIRVYELKSAQQEERVDKFLKEAFLPALHRQGIPKVGVFKPVGNDTAAIRRIYVLMAFHSMEQFTGLSASLLKDPAY